MTTYHAIDNVFTWRKLNGYVAPDDHATLIRAAFTDPDSIKAGMEENRLRRGEIIQFPEPTTIESNTCNVNTGGTYKVYTTIPSGVKYQVDTVDYDNYHVSAVNGETFPPGKHVFWLPKYPINDETGKPLDWRSLVVKE